MWIYKWRFTLKYVYSPFNACYLFKDAYKKGSDAEQNFIQNLALFFCTFLKVCMATFTYERGGWWILSLFFKWKTDSNTDLIHSFCIRGEKSSQIGGWGGENIFIFNKLGNPALPRLMIGNLAVYPHLFDFTESKTKERKILT